MRICPGQCAAVADAINSAYMNLSGAGINSPMIKSLSIKQKFIVMIVILVLPTVAISCWHYFDIVKKQTVEVAHHNQDVAANVAAKLDGLIAESFGLIRAVSMHTAVIMGDAAKIDRLFAELLPLFPLRLNIVAADLNGNNIGSGILDPQMRTFNYMDREWFCLARRGMEVVGGLHGSKMFKRPAAMVAAPVRDSHEKIVGVVGVPFDLRQLTAVMATSWHVPDQTSIVVVDNTGMVLADTEDPGKVGSKFPIHLVSCNIAAANDSHYHWVDDNGIERLVNVAPVDGRGWTVMSMIPLSKARELALSVSRVSLLVSFSAGLLAMVLAWWFGRTMMREMKELLTGMGEIERGNLDYSMKLSGTAELEQVAESFNGMAARLRHSEAELRALNAELEQRVTERTIQLEHANKELESFSYSVSHDLNAPLRRLEGFSRVLLEDYSECIDNEGRRIIKRIEHASHQMADMVNGMLNLSRLSRGDFTRETVDLSVMSREILIGLACCSPGRRVHVDVADNLQVNADPALIRVLMENLLGNAWKYTRTREQSEISVGRVDQGDAKIFFVRDNGVGFDLSCAESLFTPFQRMHREEEFEGDGIGLATVQRIVHRHGGRIWAEAAVNQGAAFFFTLGG